MKTETYVRPSDRNIRHCAGCRTPIRGKPVNALGKIWHPNCFRAHAAVRCYVCGGDIEGTYRRDYWGASCVRHNAQPRCASCTKVIAAEGGVRLGDGRTYCATCHRTAVIDRNQARSHQHVAIRFMDRLGFSITVDIPLELKNIGKGGLDPDCVGVTRTKVFIDARGRETGRQVSSIAVLAHLPATHMEAVLVHEYYHTWEHLSGVSSSRQISEGMAELCAWRFLAERPNEALAAILKQRIAEREDHVYGNGFRRMRQVMQNYGWAELIQRVATGRI